ncbi:MAG: HPP family protein [Bacilli bacterium]
MKIWRGKNIIAAVFSGVSIIVLYCISEIVNAPLVIASFGASCVILFALPDRPFAKGRNLIGGHLITSSIGVIFSNFFGRSILVIACAVSISILIMLVSNTLHPPAGGNAILFITSGFRFQEVLFIVLPGVLILYVLSKIFQEIISSCDKFSKNERNSFVE